MPWLFNSTSNVYPVTLEDGSTYGFLPKRKVFLEVSRVSAEVWRLVSNGSLVNQGGDPPAEIVSPPAPIFVPQVSVIIEKPETVTSSLHHVQDDRVIVDQVNLKKETPDSASKTTEASDVNDKADRLNKNFRKKI
jgi:hypothetical protein